VITELAANNDKIILIACDVEWGFEEFKKQFPDRFFNTGLTEQATVSLAGGLASQGFIPVVVSIAPFLLDRCLEQLKLDIDEDNHKAIFVGYEYGEKHGVSHRCMNAEYVLKMFKNIRAFFPQSKHYVSESLWTATQIDQPSFIILDDVH
jgi:transketolase C-terminal domain/subunit